MKKPSQAIKGSIILVWLLMSLPALQARGPEGGSVLSMAISPSDPRIIYIGSWFGGVFRSTDGGERWEAKDRGLSTREGVSSLLVDPADSNTVYASAPSGIPLPPVGIYKTTDGGETWRLIESGLGGNNVYYLGMAASAPNVLYAGTGVGVFRSTDSGESWEQRNGGWNTFIHCLVVDPMDPNTLYIGAGGTMLKSTDGGRTWRMILINQNKLVIDPTNPEVLYCAARGVLKSTDGGDTWNPTGLRDIAVLSLALDPVDTNTLYAGTDLEVFKSTNAGESWERWSTGLARINIISLAVDPVDPDRVFAGTFTRGVYKSTDGGTNWQARNTGLSNTTVLALAVDPRQPGVLYAGTPYLAASRSTDGGARWELRNQGLLDRPGGLEGVASLAIDPTDSGLLYAGVAGGIFKTTNAGESWAATVGPPMGVVKAFAIDATDPNIVYAGGTYPGAFKSTDRGETWMRSARGLDVGDPLVTALVIDPSDPDTIYAAGALSIGLTWAPLYKSTDGGATWAFRSAGLEGQRGTSLALDPQQPNILYLGTDFGRLGVFKSTDGGESWTRLPGFPTNTIAGSLVIDPNQPHILYAGGWGVLKSTDSGESWTAMNSGLTNLDIRTLVLDPTDPTTLYAGTGGSGVLVSHDGGETWH